MRDHECVGRARIAIAAGAVALCLGGAPVAAATLMPDWRDPPSDLPVDLWRLGQPTPPLRIRLAEAGMPRLAFTGAGLVESTISDARRIQIARTDPRRMADRVSDAEATLFALDERAPLPHSLADQIAHPRLPLADDAGVDLLGPLFGPAPGRPLPWAIESPSVMHEIQRTHPRDLRRQASLGLRDPLRSGLAARLAPAYAAPNWAHAVTAGPDDSVRGVSQARAARISRLQTRADDDTRALRAVVVGAAGVGGLAMVVLTTILFRGRRKKPRPLTSRRFG